MTSNGWPSEIAAADYKGLLSADPEINPLFWNANVIHIKYCSSDIFVGSSNEMEHGYYFRGFRIIEGVLATIASKRASFSDAKHVLVFGSGRGAMAASFNFDIISDALVNLGIKREVIRGIIDAGWASKFEPYSPRTCLDQVGACNYAGVFRSGVEIWKPTYPEFCLDLWSDEPWMCLFANVSYSYLQTPVFVMQNQFDYTQLDGDGASILHGYLAEPAVAYAKRCRDSMLSLQLPILKWAFLPSCYGHKLAVSDEWLSLGIFVEGGRWVNVQEAIHTWYSTPLDQTQIYVDWCEGWACNPTCESIN
jgi:hypothetical protein